MERNEKGKYSQIAPTLVGFLNLLLAALVAGTMFGIWLGFDPRSLSASTYVEHQQNTILALNILMPLLGLFTILLTLLSAFLQRVNKVNMFILLVAAGLFIISGLITRFGNQPINSMMMNWDVNNPPANWTQLRNQWWSLHTLRTLTGSIGLCLIILASIKRSLIHEHQ